MRAIKFRGKSLYYNECEYGDLLQYDDGDVCIGVHSKNYTDDGFNAGLYRRIVLVDKYTVGQYIGLKDKNGKEIYENDIIECISSDNKPIRHLVKYNYEKGGYSQLLFMGNGLTCEPYDGGLISQNYIREMGKYIIGNIHDNPELLKGGEQ